MSVESFINEMETSDTTLAEPPKKGKLIVRLIDPIPGYGDSDNTSLVFFLKDYVWVNDPIGWSIQDRKTLITLMIPYSNITAIEIDPEKTTKRLIC